MELELLEPSEPELPIDDEPVPIEPLDPEEPVEPEVPLEPDDPVPIDPLDDDPLDPEAPPDADCAAAGSATSSPAIPRPVTIPLLTFMCFPLPFAETDQAQRLSRRGALIR